MYGSGFVLEFTYRTSACVYICMYMHKCVTLPLGSYLNLNIARVGVSQKYMLSAPAGNAIVFEHLRNAHSVRD